MNIPFAQNPLLHELMFDIIELRTNIREGLVIVTHEHSSLISFQEKFSTVCDCENYLFSFKWPDGYRCEKCDHSEFFMKEDIG